MSWALVEQCPLQVMTWTDDDYDADDVDDDDYLFQQHTWSTFTFFIP